MTTDRRTLTGDDRTQPTGPRNGFKHGRFIAEEITQLDGTKVVKIRSSLGSFTPDLYDEFLGEYEHHGRLKTAAIAVGVSANAVRRVILKDQAFAEACLEAEDEYRMRVIEHVQNLVFEGTTKESYDRNGNLVSTEQVYPIPLIQMEARRVEEGYRDKRDVNMNVSGGVLVAPAEVKSIDDWSKKFGDGEVIEGEAVDISEKGDDDV